MTYGLAVNVYTITQYTAAHNLHTNHVVILAMNVILLITACFAGLLMAASISEAADISGSAKHRTAPHNRTDIYFAAFFPLTPVGSLDAKIGHGVMPAVRLAIKHINQSPNILKGYKLHMYWNDTQVLVNLSLISIISKNFGCMCTI